MFEKFNGTPLYLVKLLTTQRTEYQVDGPLTQLAAEQRSHYASVRYQPGHAREQDVRKGYFREASPV